MAKQKQKKEEHRKLDLSHLKVQILCPVHDKWFDVKIEFDLSCSSDECECCGTHTYVAVDSQCPHCKNFHEVTIRDD